MTTDIKHARQRPMRQLPAFLLPWGIPMWPAHRSMLMPLRARSVSLLVNGNDVWSQMPELKRMANIHERLQAAIAKWIEHGRGEQGMLREYEYLRVSCWLRHSHA